MQTAAGYHYYLDFLGCQRKWFIRHLLKLSRSEGLLAPSLLLGTATHAALLTYYETPGLSSSKLIEAFMVEFLAEEFNYLEAGLRWDENAPTDKQRDTLLEVRGPNSLLEWYKQIGESLHDYYTFLEGEVENTFELPNGMRITYRTDRMIESKKTSRRFIIDTKTTGYSYMGAAEGVAEDDQSTTYLLGADQNGHDVDAVIPEILYSRGSKARAGWPFEISRSKPELADWQHSLTAVSEETSQKAEAWETGNYVPGDLFVRNPKGCSWQGKCAFPEFCRCPPEPGTVPHGFTKEE